MAIIKDLNMIQKAFNLSPSILILILIFIYGCSNEGPTSTIENSPPGVFDVYIDYITQNSATIFWTEASANNPSEIFYTIYLNDLLIAENLDVFTFELENLNPGKFYNVKVIAINEFGENESLSSFSTLELQDLLISEYKFSNSSINVDYDENNKIIQKGSPFNYTNYSYDQNKKITTEFGGPQGPVFSSTQYTYQNTNLSTILLREGNEEFWEIEFSFSSDQTSYTKTVSYVLNGMITQLGQYEISGNFNNEGQLISLESLNLNTLEVEVFNFEYLNGNLIKIIDPNSDVWEILYDNKKTFHTYRSGCSDSYWRALFDVAGLIFLDEDLASALRHIPFLFDSNNSNNPIEYKKNGTTYRSFNYDYNDSNYPIKIITENNEILLSYIEI
ncbi:MAG: hypothetical protein COS19_00325 [Flavobacteriaceae bacterium CG02_land_8_20_14_3_00_34_13]|nr:MAG: hypothetical protein COS19_00325 [Flavobacteriaceae bacterium CG02_land_8_20_14_3_00_34_13]